MLVSLKINNIAIIEQSSIQFKSGLNILTGETGAGKSIIIDALNFVLGARADKGLIKNGAENAKVEGVFEVDVNNAKIAEFFESIGQEVEDTVIVTRNFSVLGKNDIRVNGEIVTLGMLKNLTSQLVDIYGQHEHQALLDVKTHVKMLDMVNAGSMEQIKNQLKENLMLINSINKSISELGGSAQERSRLIDIYNFQIEEINNANLVVGEEEELQSKKLLLNNAEKLFSNLSQAHGALYESDYSAIAAVKNAINSLNAISSIKESFESLNSRLNSVKFELQDVADEISNSLGELTFSENELNEIEERLDLIKNLKRKYGASITEILAFKENMEEKLNALCNCAEKIERLNNEKLKTSKNIFSLCQQLTAIRRENAVVLEEKISQELTELGMKNANFVVDFGEKYIEEEILNVATQNGADKVEFLFSANLGEPAKPLNKIISGGEMSRFMLAFKCVLNTLDYSKTFVFDEIDAGIGGAVGVVLAKKMAKIAKNNQVICITHLPQIASFASVHFKIEKHETDSKTITEVNVLTPELHIKELARMLGGDENANAALLHAEELATSAENYIQNNL